MSSESTGRRGLFIVLEGLDGAGKTTIARMLVRELEGLGYKAIYTYEPTDSEIVNVVKSRYGRLRDPYIDALTFALDRLVHVKTLIKPALEEGYIVVADRYYYSSAAYQTAGGAPMEWVLEVNKWALKPDIAIYLDIDPVKGLERKAGLTSRFSEFEEVEFLRRVREAYLRMVEMNLMIKVDAERPVDEVYADVRRIVLEALGQRATST